MTARELLRQRVRQSWILNLPSGPGVFFVSLVGMAPLLALSPERGREAYLYCVFPGALLITSIFFYVRQFCASLRCPWCRRDLSLLMLSVSSEHVRHCPYCGTSLDEELPAASKPAKIKSTEDEIA